MNKTLSNTNTGTNSSSLSHIVIRRLLIVWLPIIIVGVVIFWLSGGIPPTSWRLLAQMWVRWDDLQAGSGNEVFGFLFILLIQSLLILLAWIILGFTIWREISTFTILRNQQHMLDLQARQAASLAKKASSNQGVKLLPEKNTGIQIVSLDEDEQEDAFDMNNAVLELSEETDEPIVEEAPVPTQHIKEETVFLYGNPFEGDLPEVFHYDADLKREVQTIQEEIRTQLKEDEDNVPDTEDQDNKTSV